MLSRLIGIAINSFLETIRQPIFLVMLGVMAFLFIMNVGLAAFTLDDDDKLLMDLGLSTLLLGGMFLASFSASGVLTREIENKTAMTVIAKPVPRIIFIAGKYIGLLAAVCVAFYLAAIWFALAQRHAVLQTSADPWDMPVIVFGFGALFVTLITAAFANYFHEKEFASTILTVAVPAFTLALFLTGLFDEKFEVQEYWGGMIGGEAILAVFLTLMAVLVLAAVALAASTRMGQISTLMTCLIVLILGLLSDYMFGRSVDSSMFAQICYWIIPNQNFFSVTQALHAEEIHIPLSYIPLTLGYSACFTMASLLVGVALFQNREVG